MPKKQKRTAILLIVFIIIVAGAVGYSIWANRVKAPTVSTSTTPTITTQTTTTATPVGTAAGLSTCVILDQQYCNSGKLINRNSDYYVAFNLPSSAKIYAPFDGVFMTTGSDGKFVANGKVYQLGTLEPTYILPPNTYNPTSSTPQFLVLAGINPGSDVNVKKGQLLGTVGSQVFNGYNLSVSFNTYDTNKLYFTPSLSLIKQYFPNL